MMGQGDPNLEGSARVNPPVDRNLVEQLLQDEGLSYREVARQAGCSDWSVRRIARQLNADMRPMKSVREGVGSVSGPGPIVIGIIILAFIGMTWLRIRRKPFQGGGLMS